MLEFLAPLLYNIVPFVLVLTVLVFVHEFGHFWVARYVGVKVEVFSIGFGKELFGFNDKHGTRWKFCLLPLGGYVKMFGDKNSASQADDIERLNNFSAEEKKIAFPCQSLTKKAAIVFAGPFANYLFAAIIFAGFFTAYGIPHAEPIVTKIIEASPASISGIEVGDRIIAMNGVGVESFNDISNIMSLNTGEAVNLIIKRDESTIDKSITPMVLATKDLLGNEIKTYKLGIMAENVTLKPQDIFSASKAAIFECFNLSYMSLKAMGQIITGNRSAKELGGPIKIAQYSAKSAEQGMQAILWLLALLSVNLGLINLLPIPVLDGGHLLMYVVEFGLGKKIATKIQDFSFQIGLILLIMITLLVTFNDLSDLNLFSYKVSK